MITFVILFDTSCDHTFVIQVTFEEAPDADSTWEKIRSELDKVWKDLNDGCRKASKLLSKFDEMDSTDLTTKIRTYMRNLSNALDTCERDRHEVEYAVKWRKDMSGADMTLGKGQDLQAKSCGHLEDLLDSFRTARANVPKKARDDDA